MQFLSSWRDGLLLLKPDNAKLFGLVTLNACVHTWRTLGTHFWWLILGTGVLIFFDGRCWLPLTVLALLLLMFVVYLAARPSTLRKDFNYFLGYGIYFIAFSLFFILWLILLCTLGCLGLPCWFPALPVLAPLFPVFSIFTAFLCDADGSAKSAILSVYRSLLFVAYNFPICLFFATLFFGIARLIFLFPCPWADMLLILFWPVPVCTYINVYVKRVHEQFPLYFGG